MNTSLKLIVTVLVMTIFGEGCTAKKKHHEAVQTSKDAQSKKTTVQIIVGSTRQGRMSDKIAHALKDMVKDRSDITTEVVDLRTYHLPFLNDEIAPASRKVITDPVIATWSQKISEADAYIIVVPEYNAGYPGVLKNALDSLYKEWNNKPVALVGYSGGPSGGASALAQLRTVTQAFKMIPVSQDIKIPFSWKAFDEDGNLVDKNIPAVLNTVIDQIIDLISGNK